MTNFPKKVNRVLLVTEHFWPEGGATSQIISSLEHGLVLDGLETTVLTASPFSQSSPKPDSQRVIRLNSHHPPSTSIISKVLQGCSFFFRSLLWLIINSTRRDVILIVSNPPFIGLTGLITSLFKSSQYIYILQDIFPRSAVLSGILPANGPLTSLWQWLMKHVCEKSYATVVLSESMKKCCQREISPNANYTVIHNWSVSDPPTVNRSENPFINEWDLEHDFIVQYSGNFGRMHDFITLIEAARLLRQHPIKFVFIGNGPKQDQIQAYIDHFCLENVLLKPYQSLDKLPFSLAACDISSISFTTGAEETVAPSKLYGILCSAKPLIVVGSLNSDISRLVRLHNCGITVERGDSCELATQILLLARNPAKLAQLSHNAYRAYLSIPTRSASIKHYSSLIKDCLRLSA